MSEEYRYRWSFGDGQKITDIEDRKRKTGEDKVSLKKISACHACIISDGKPIADLEKKDLTQKGESGTNYFRKFLRDLISEININIDKIITSQNTADIIKKLDELKQETYKRQNNEELSKNFFLGIKKLVDPYSTGSFFEFNIGSKDSSTNDSDNQEDNAEGDAGNLIEKAIESSAKRKKCVVFTGAPGTGKTYCVEKYVEDQEQMKNFDRKEYFVQFHSSYDYTDFVEGLRPIKREVEEDGKKVVKMTFERMDGIFKAFCRKVVELPNKKDDEDIYYYFVIDEINRADLGRVFGELMYCFEKRGKKIATQYANLDTYGKDGKPIKDTFGYDCFKDGFYIPENVVIIGTMNDIDRSVETFDFALRRRFDWVEIKADDVMESSLRAMMEHLLEEEKKTEEAKVRSFVDALVRAVLPGITKMNKIIEKKSVLGEEYKIGHAYFKDYDAETGFKLYDEKSGLNQENHTENLNAIWEHNIEPILREYMRGRQKAGEFVIECGVSLGVLPPSKETPKTDSPQGIGDGAAPQPGVSE